MVCLHSLWLRATTYVRKQIKIDVQILTSQPGYKHGGEGVQLFMPLAPRTLLRHTIRALFQNGGVGDSASLNVLASQ